MGCVLDMPKKMFGFQVGAKAGPITNQSKETEVLLTMLDDPFKVGLFGIGFNSFYHLTGAVCIYFFFHFS